MLNDLLNYFVGKDMSGGCVSMITSLIVQGYKRPANILGCHIGEKKFLKNF
jgi:hypothetical protein